MKKKKLKKRLDKLETALFFQNQTIKELEAKIEPKEHRINPHLITVMDTPNKIDPWSIAKMDIEEAVKKLEREGYTDGVTFWLPVVGMCGPMPIRKAVEYIHMHVRPIE